MKNIIIILSAILIIAGGAYVLLKDEDRKTDTPITQSTSQNNARESQDTGTASDSMTISFDGDSFSPETLSVKVGDTVTVKNDSSRTIQFDSDPHPAHTDNTDLNVDTIRAGQSKSFATTRTGTFGYHDHLNPNATGAIIVK
jgi:plastocyanin